MHYCGIIVTPPVEDYEATIIEALEPYRHDCEEPYGRPFFDWFSLGGRFINWTSPEGRYTNFEGASEDERAQIIRNVSDVPPDEQMWFFGILGPGLCGDGKKLELDYLLQKEFWNGVNHQKTTFRGTFQQGCVMYNSWIERYKNGRCPKDPIQDDWKAVIVDFHN